MLPAYCHTSCLRVQNLPGDHLVLDIKQEAEERVQVSEEVRDILNINEI